VPEVIDVDESETLLLTELVLVEAVEPFGVTLMKFDELVARPIDADVL
jgi:hypothetical protein